jgi:hypothetical protein
MFRRWHTTVGYRVNAGLVDVGHDLEEIADRTTSSSAAHTGTRLNGLRFAAAITTPARRSQSSRRSKSDGGSWL